eukprot:g672.t1
MFLIFSRLHSCRFISFLGTGRPTKTSLLFSRLLSTNAKFPERELKSCLHALYKLVHPDLFANLPLERAENTRSLKLLHDYLAQCRGDYSGPTAPFRFAFYVRNQTPSSSRKIALTLPPPVTVPDSFPLPISTRNNLQRLLSAVGVPDELTIRLQAAEEEESLRSFLITAAEHVRWNEATNSSSVQRLHNAKLVIQMTKQITVRLSAHCETLSTSKQAEFVERLAWALDRCWGLDFRNQMMVIGGQGIDSGGRLWLPDKATQQDWLKILLDIDIGEMRNRRDTLANVKSKEKETASKIGIGMIFTSAEIRVQCAYSRFLDDLIFMTRNVGGIGKGGGGRSFETLALCIVPQESDMSEISIDPELGFIRVPLNADPAKIFRFIEDHGKEALAVQSRYHRNEKDLEDLVLRVRQKLRLRRLDCDATVSRQNYREACNRLMHNSDQFGDWIEGLCIRIAHANRLIKDSTLVEIKWNFQI